MLRSAASKKIGINFLLVILGLIVATVIVWQAITSAGSPDPTRENHSQLSAIFDIGVLVFREGLECILVLSAITASMVGGQRAHRRPVAVGAGVGFVATLLTWFVAVRIVHSLSDSVSALNLQAATGLLAVIVLLIVMNWFFHKVYWGGWIKLHNRQKKSLLDPLEGSGHSRLLLGLGLLGFSSLYREGFEVVLFLQTYYLKLGGQTVLSGAAIGLVLTAIVAVLNFVAHQRLPYRKMLIFTGVMLGVVLLIMVGEQAQEMQQAHWIPTTDLAWLKPSTPDWMGVWFSVFPTVETIGAQVLAAFLVIGSYFLAQRLTQAPATES